MCSIHNEGKSVVAEGFVRTLKSKVYKYMTSISKIVYIGKSDDIVTKYNNTYIIEQLKWSLSMKSQANIITSLKKIIRKVLM